MHQQNSRVSDLLSSNVLLFNRMSFAGNVIGGITSRRGTIVDSEVRDDEFTVIAEVALNDMFGYSSQLRGQTQGKGEFSMEYKVSFRTSWKAQVDFLPHRLICQFFQTIKRSLRRHIARVAPRKSRAFRIIVDLIISY